MNGKNNETEKVHEKKKQQDIDEKKYFNQEKKEKTRVNIHK